MAEYLQLRQRFGIDRAVLVHPSVFGMDHRSLEDMLQAHGSWLRGVAVVYPDTTEAQIAHWHALGVRGTRVNALFAGGPDPADLRQLVEKVAPYGWHVQLLIDVAAQPDLVGAVCDMGVEVVVDHLGHHPPEALPQSAGFANLLALVREERAWVKLSGPYRVASDAPHYGGSQALVQALLAANPGTLLWGTDWPHPSSAHPVPPLAQLVDLVFDWLPDAALRQAVLVDNPTRLYWRGAETVRAVARQGLSVAPVGALSS